MKLSIYLNVALLAAGLTLAGTNLAAAQSDRTLGVNCTEAGHIHCGENGPIFGSHRVYSPYYRWHRHHYYRHYYRPY
ncbi:MAG TPA: hypothetical protein VFB45_00065 [Pseudolabrys sp.]|nr:hypothetical protein [Pseudolabrys sp.]